ncbi:hypothetical protein AX14_008339 [Amanita brunnescens Koide BX004]|nr:hypothetical protein AX14_008339 [Amanita brunnescens Koide BX004]
MPAPALRHLPLHAQVPLIRPPPAPDDSLAPPDDRTFRLLRDGLSLSLPDVAFMSPRPTPVGPQPALPSPTVPTAAAAPRLLVQACPPHVPAAALHLLPASSNCLLLAGPPQPVFAAPCLPTDKVLPSPTPSPVGLLPALAIADSPPPASLLVPPESSAGAPVPMPLALPVPLPLPLPPTALPLVHTGLPVSAAVAPTPPVYALLPPAQALP